MRFYSQPWFECLSSISVSFIGSFFSFEPCSHFYVVKKKKKKKQKSKKRKEKGV